MMRPPAIATFHVVTNIDCATSAASPAAFAMAGWTVSQAPKDFFGDVIAEGVDAVMRTGQTTDSRFMSRPLGSYRLLLVASTDHVARHKDMAPKLRAVIDVTVGALFAERTVAFGNARTTAFPSSVRRP